MDVLDGYREHVENIMSKVDKAYIEGMRAINRQERIDLTARAAIQCIFEKQQGVPVYPFVAKECYDLAEAMEEERERRIKGGE